MEVKKSLFIMAFVITCFLLVSILLLTTVIDDKREEFITHELDNIINSFNEMQTLILMGEVYGDKMVCIISLERLKSLDESLWTLGRKIDQYRQVSEEFFKSEYYSQQKKIFNEKEVFYLHLLKSLKQKCDFTQPIVLFFYQNSEDCKKCDDQSFVLSDINEEIDEEISIFSFDMDLNLTTLKFLTSFYNIGQYPCVVIDDQKYCGMQDKTTLIRHLCEGSNLTICNSGN